MTEPSERELEHQRMVEAVLFASETALSVEDIAERLPDGADVPAHIASLAEEYATKGVNLVSLAGKYMFRTAEDLAFLLRREVDEPRKLSRAAVETLSIIAYHQPVTRAEIEDIRGVTISKGTLDVLMEAGWVRMLGRRKTPGRPVTYGTTEEFLVHFGIESIKDLPGLQELKAAGLLDSVDTALDKMGGMPAPGESSEEDDGQIDLEEAIADSERETSNARNREDTGDANIDSAEDVSV
jgi:segregation and condensation protein B